MAAGINGLYAVTPDTFDTAWLIGKTRAALEGGASLVQYRNKNAGGALRLEQARALRALCGEFGVPFLVNDDLGLAEQIASAGVHLGANDAPVSRARARLGDGKIIGVSCYNRLENALAAQRQGADYVAFGSFFASPVKPGAVVAPLDLLREARRSLRIPLVAIGGITPENAAPLLAAGADALAVISALFADSDTRAAAQKFAKLFE